MLFYSQIKREFSQSSWKRGQTYFREERVTNVRQNGDTVVGRVQGTGEGAYDTSIVMARGSIFSSKCNCPAHRVYETHCKHVAALAIWIVERGSILRAGIASASHGTAKSENELIIRNVQKAAADPRLKKLMLGHPELGTSRFVIRREMMAASLQGTNMMSGQPFSIPISLFEAAALLDYSGKENENPEARKYLEGEAVLYVRGLFQTRALTALTLEGGIRYIDPNSNAPQVSTMSFLTKQKEPGLYSTSDGLLLKVPAASEVPNEGASFIQRLDQGKVSYQGQQALENLAKLLTHRRRDLIVFHPNVNVPVETVPLKLVSVTMGGKQEKSRELKYEFQVPNGGPKLSTEELEDLQKQGRLSNEYVWFNDRIYRFEIPLLRLAQYSNRSGVAANESEDDSPVASAKGVVYDAPDSPLHPIAAYRLSLELGVANFEVDGDWAEYHEWRKTFDRKRLPAMPKAEYGFELRDYQKNGLTWMWSLYHRGLAALLADDMGLGKTHQVLAFMTTLYGVKRNRPKNPSLVVAPTSVVAAWVQKLKKYDTSLKWHVFHGAGRKLPAEGVDLVLTTYGILHREAALRDKPWHVVVLDEAQAIKNAQTISSRAARALKADFRIAMTGTPVENQATDLWSLMDFLLPGYMGSLPRFKRLYGTGRDALPEVQSAALRRLVTPFLLRRTKSQVLKELPVKTEEVVSCELSQAQRRAYKEILNGTDATKARDSLKKGDKVDYANILAVLTRLKQICDHPELAALTAGKATVDKVDPTDSGKWETFTELLEEALGSNLKIVVFTQYLGMIEMMAHHLKSKNVGYTELRGDTPDRAGRLELFANDPECRVFLCSLLAGGLGIDLTAGSVCVHYDRWWNPAKENQATDRLHRLGQTRGVQVFKLQIVGSVEDRIASIIESKMKLSDALIEESSLGLKSFSKKELLDLLQPLPDADDGPEGDDLDPAYLQEYEVHTS